jgi:hypothetical protein
MSLRLLQPSICMMESGVLVVAQVDGNLGVGVARFGGLS